MNQIFEFFSKLLESSHKTARWHTGNWSDFLGWMFILSDFIIGVAYILVPVFMFYYVKSNKKETNYSVVFLLFIAFFMMNSINYFVDIVMFWIPAYRLNTITRFATAALSVAAGYYLVHLLPSFFKPRANTPLAIEMELREEAERKLAIANADLERYAYVTSHDMQEPLRKIILYAEMLGQKNHQQFDGHSADLLQKIMASSHRMQRLITDVLSFTKLGQEVNMEAVPVKEIIEQVIEEFDLKIRDRNAIITISELPVVKGDRVYLHQLFYNLIGNGIKFSTSRPEITISGKTEGGKAFISVADKGIGIDEAYFEKIFLPFQRLNANSKFEGSGIGLSLCKKIVNILAGDIIVESKPGIGSTFVVELALAT